MKKIAHFADKLKAIERTIDRDDIFVVLLIILVGMGSFALGRLSNTKSNKSPITIENTQFGISVGSQGTENVSDPANRSGEVVGSKNSSKYHFPWCSGAQRIKEENKILFDSIEAARAVGYEPAANCKGLK